MRFRLAPVAAAITAGLTAVGLALATPSTGLAQQPAAHAARFTTELRYSFDRGETLRTGTIVHDVSRHRHAGVVRTRYKGHIAPVRTPWGHGASFPVQCRGCRKAVIESPDGPGLDPRLQPFFFRLSLKVTRPEARGSSNLIQKGGFHQVGGQYKLQMDNGVPSCVVRGGAGRLKAHARRSIADGAWHSLTCARTAAGITLSVDGHVVKTTRGHTGIIINHAPFRVGGHNLRPPSDQYHGDLDNVVLSIQRR
jgi:hypothetical protein